MRRTRGFEFTREYLDSGVTLPARSTSGSAGYDLAAAVEIRLGPGDKAVVPTGVKAYMQPGEYLGIHIRSSLAIKQGLFLANGQGIIDSDYYNNSDNEGHILIALVNGGPCEVIVTKGMRVAQGIFYNYLLADQDEKECKELRSGGIGSTGR